MALVRQFAVVLAGVAMLAQAALAASGQRCARCGCCNNLRKVCRAIPEVKEITTVCWDVKCEDFCVPGPSKKCGVVHECDECGPWCRTIWQPTCACVRTRRVPVKKEVTRKVPTVRWEVETVCAHCCQACAGTYRELTAEQKLASAFDRFTLGPKQSADFVSEPAPAQVRPVEAAAAGYAEVTDSPSVAPAWQRPLAAPRPIARTAR